MHVSILLMPPPSTGFLDLRWLFLVYFKIFVSSIVFLFHFIIFVYIVFSPLATLYQELVFLCSSHFIFWVIWQNLWCLDWYQCCMWDCEVSMYVVSMLLSLFDIVGVFDFIYQLVTVRLFSNVSMIPVFHIKTTELEYV